MRTPAASIPALAAGLALLLGGLPGPAARAQTAAPATLTVQVNKPVAAVPKNLFGLFFEDINFAADGGLYPELVKNKSFETDDHLSLTLAIWARSRVKKETR